MNAIDLQYHRKFQDALGSGDMFALYERTREAIAKFPDDPEVRYLQALAMARLGDPHAAMRLYERNRVEEISSEDAIKRGLPRGISNVGRLFFWHKCGHDFVLGRR